MIQSRMPITDNVMSNLHEVYRNKTEHRTVLCSLCSISTTPKFDQELNI